ncbi:hypothetical protein KXW38_002312, partial [Aspergillus fumigatus]
MLAWAGYTLVQNRVGAGVSFLARIGMFAAFGAMFSVPFAAFETWSDPSVVLSFKAAKVYLFAGLVPGLFAYSAYSYFGSAFGALSTSLSMYLGPVVGAVLFPEFSDFGAGELEPAVSVVIGLGFIFISGFALLPAMIVALITEAFSIRGILAYAVGGAI